MNIVVKKALLDVERNACLAIRMQVFIKGQGVPIAEELDGKDDSSDHYLLTVDEVPVGVARVRFLGDVAKLERVAILENYQGKGLGELLMRNIMALLKINPKVSMLKLSSQVHAIPFYEKLGFTISSDEYIDAGIPHKDMQFTVV